MTWLAPFRRFWSVHVDALERHLDRMDRHSDEDHPGKKATPAVGARQSKEGNEKTARPKPRTSPYEGNEMKIKLTSVYVDDQDKALRLYTEVLGFAKKADFSNGPYRWLTVASPEDPDGTRVAIGAEQQPRCQSVSAGAFPAGPARGHVLHRRRQGRL